MFAAPPAHLKDRLADAQAQGRLSAFIDYAMFERHAGFGGIRVENDVLITPQGARVLRPAIPRLARKWKRGLLSRPP
jgi:Xaa-Pro aminopeptidase